MNMTRLIGGGVVVAGLAYLGYFFLKDIIILHEHDEPVIVENGSLVVDLNPRDNPYVLGSMSSHQGYQVYPRYGSDPVRRVRIFKKAKPGAAFLEFYCGSNKEHCLTPAKKESEFIIALTNGYSVSIGWSGKDKDGVMLFSSTQRLEPAALAGKKNPHRVMTLPDSVGKQPTIEALRFTANGTTWDVKPDPGGDIVAQLCTSDNPEDEDHCTYYKPIK